MNPAYRPSAEFEELLNAMCEGELSPAQARELETIVESSDDACRHYLCYIHLHGTLHWDGGEQLRASEAAESRRIASVRPSRTDAGELPQSSVSGFLPSALYSSVGWFSSGWPVAYLISTVILSVGILTSSLIPASRAPQIATHSPDAAQLQSQPEPARKVVGHITGTMNCQWSDAAAASDGGRVLLGRRYALAGGLLEITYGTGAKVILQGPATFEVDSDRGGHLSLGRLTARLEGATSHKSEIRNPKSETISKAPNLQISKFVVRTPTAVVTDLGTEFGVEVAKSGETTSHVYRGSVRVQPVGRVGERCGDALVLVANESVRTRKTDQPGGLSVVLHRVSIDPGVFVRQIDARSRVIDLLDIVAGGDGAGYRRERGIDPSTGIQDSLFVPSWRLGGQQYHHTSRYQLLDGVFVADGSQGPVLIDSAGHTFDGFPKTSGKSWGSIWARAAGVQPDARALGAEYWVYAVDSTSELMPKNRGLLALGCNAGITFDLATLRRAHRSRPFARFCTTAATYGTQPSDLWVFVDGRPAWKATGINSTSGVQRVEVPIGPTDQFLTLVTTDRGNRTVRGGAYFADPVLTPASSKQETAAAAAATMLAVAPATSIIYAEDFESFSAGPLFGQGGWKAGIQPGTINVGAGGHLSNMQILAVRTGNGIPDAVHSLGPLAHLDSSQVTTLQWDAEYGGNNSAFGFSSVPTNPKEDLVAHWCSTRTGWNFVLFDGVEVDNGRASVAGGTSGVVHLKLVIDGPARTLAGYYDFGHGWTQGGRCVISLAQIEAMERLYLIEDYRDYSGTNGVGVDNITLSTSVVPKPDRVRAKAK
jgi:hypothetical protein